MIQNITLNKTIPPLTHNRDLFDLKLLIDNDLNGNLQGLTDYEEYQMAEDLQKKIDSLKG